MQADLPDDPLSRETMASLGPGAKDATLDDLAAWVRQLEQLCDSRDGSLAPTSFHTGLSGSCLSTFPASENKLANAANTTELQTKTIKGYPPLLELHMEDLIPIRYPATTIEATVIPLAPGQLLERLRLVESKIKEQRGQHVQPTASPQRYVKAVPAPRQADGVEYTKKRIGGQIIERFFDPQKGTVTVKSSGCANPYCDEVNCTAAPVIITLNVKTGETAYTTDSPHMNVPPMLKSFQKDPHRQLDISKRAGIIMKEARSIKEKLPSAKPAEKKRLIKELEKKYAEFAKVNELTFRTAETGGWLRVPDDELLAVFAKADRTDPNRFPAIASRALVAIDEYEAIKEKYETTTNRTKKKQLSTLMVRKGIEFDAVMNEMAAIADGSEQEQSKELNDVCIRMKRL